MLGNRCFILFFIVLLSCAKEEYKNTEIWGHAGTGLKKFDEYPDNSLESLEKAWYLYQVEGVEIDIQLSRSGNFWLYHDERLDSKTNGSGCINGHTDEELEKITYNGKIPNSKKIYLSSLNEVLSAAPQGSKIMLDIRTRNFCTETSIPDDSIVKYLKDIKNQFPEIQLYPSSFSAELLKKLHQEGFEHLFWERPTIESITDDGYLFDAVVMKNSSISKEDIQRLNQEGKEVMIFEVRSISGLQYALKKSPQYILSDHLKVN